MSSPQIAISVEDLAISYRNDHRWQKVVSGVSFSIYRKEIFGLVGESGSGKTTLALQLLGYRISGSRVESGYVRFEGTDLLALPRSKLDDIRGNRIAFVPQNPTTALNPAIAIGRQITEVLVRHGKYTDSGAARKRLQELLLLVGLSDISDLAVRYPHQLSGGQQQRVCIAIALACNPALVVLDEPTTGLDVTTQEQILNLLMDLRAKLGMSMMYVTHDLNVISEIADRVGVMYAGHLVEVGPSTQILNSPVHPYTRGLVTSTPSVAQPSSSRRLLRGLLRRDDLPSGCPFQPRCDFAEPTCATRPQVLDLVSERRLVACQRWRELPTLRSATEVEGTAAAKIPPNESVLDIDKLTVTYSAPGGIFTRLLESSEVTVVRELSFSIKSGEIFALVGESGSGKSTIARAISGLVAPKSGEITLEGRSLPARIEHRTKDDRRKIQYIFQNPDASLNPRARVRSILSRPLRLYFDLGQKARAERIEDLLADVRLGASYAQRFPNQLSGGERQRVAIARALIAEPDLLLCDEILSALDASVQANILDLLRSVRERRHLSMLFISHDLAVVRTLANRVGVIFRGQLMEIGETEFVFSPPFHPYTHTLLLAVPGQHRSQAARSLKAPLRPSIKEPKGCTFAGRCPWQPGSICETTRPPWRETKAGVQIRCHLALSDLFDRATWPHSQE